ncbi:helix-turn-helix domain-containing protein [Clostridium ljungdahlii]|uniref:HTH-type transcriptional regulator SinR n=1 Tax=Clostridium ljungdahlii TaxID=1538 RepID=A0A168PI88_9CLOT|nr:helix-turn-helix transcriptional regulator [Clostridium ljungdahlii]OAA87780.1 HTH-type transcriptional regulator SinR [Clostridium ljungdahlii]
MENTQESFGSLIKYLRKQKGMSLKELSDITNLSCSYISRMETEERVNPTIYCIQKLMAALNIDISTIENLFPFSPEEKIKKDIDTIEDLLLNERYLFGQKEASISVKLSLRELIKILEEYVTKEACDREDETNILQQADNLKKEIRKSI